METGLSIPLWREDSIMSDSFASFEEMKNKGELCDIKVKVGNQIFSAHRVVLAAKLPYIREVCSATKTEELDLSEFNPSAVELLIRFAYGKKPTISPQLVYRVLAVSQFLRVKQVSDECVKFLMNSLMNNASNAITYAVYTWQFAQKCRIPILANACAQYLRENFEKFLESDSFAKLPFPYLKELISGDYLSVSSEEVVFEAIVKWAKVSPFGKHVPFSDLLREVRTIYLPKDYLIEQVACEELVKNSTHCRELIDEAKNYHILPTKRSAFPNLKTLPRRCIKAGLYIICQGLASGPSLYHYDVHREKWLNLIPELQDDRIHCAAIVGDKIYTFLEKKIKAYNLRTLAYEHMNPTHEDVEGAAIVCHEDRIYCFGSCSQCFSYAKRVRCFDTQTKWWMKRVSRMREARGWSAAASLGEFIYVTGGSCGNEVYKSAEKFQPSSRQCSKIAFMLTEREGHGCATMNGKIYVCGGGGSTANRFLCTAEAYDPATDLWILISPAKIPRRGFSLVSYYSKLYVLGGTTEDKEEALDVEIYDGLNSQWESGFRLYKGFRCAVSIPGPVTATDLSETQQKDEQKPSCSFGATSIPKRQKTE